MHEIHRVYTFLCSALSDPVVVSTTNSQTILCSLQVVPTRAIVSCFLVCLADLFESSFGYTVEILHCSFATFFIIGIVVV